MRAILRTRRDPRIWLVDASLGYVHRALAYARTGTILVRTSDGSLTQYAASTLPLAADATLGPYYRMNPAYNQVCLRTNALTNAVWARTGMAGSSQDAIGPSGATDSWSFVESGATSTHKAEQTIAFTTGVTYTITVIASARAGTRYLTLLLPTAAFGADAIATFSLVDGSSVKNATALAARSEQLANGNWILSITATATATASGAVGVALHRTLTATVDSYAGDTTSGVSIWGVNVTDTAYRAPFATSAGSATAIGASSWGATLASLGISLSNNYTIGCEYFATPLAITPPARVALTVDNGGVTERAILRYNSAAGAVRGISVSGNTTTTVDSFTISEGVRVRQAMRMSASMCKAASNGVLGAGLSTTLPAGLTTVRLGHDSGGNQLSGGLIRAYIIPNAALADSALLAFAR